MTKQFRALQMAINALTNCSRFEEAIQACKEALEQPAQEPIHNCPNCNSLFTTEIHSIPAPAWQGLSDDELDALNGSPMALEYSGLYKFARAIEQALKEKNT